MRLSVVEFVVAPSTELLKVALGKTRVGERDVVGMSSVVRRILLWCLSKDLGKRFG